MLAHARIGLREFGVIMSIYTIFASGYDPSAPV